MRLSHNVFINRNKNIGNAGEFQALAQLAQRGYIARKTDEGQTLIDVIAREEEPLRTINIQVKSTISKNSLHLSQHKKRKILQIIFVQIHCPFYITRI